MGEYLEEIEDVKNFLTTRSLLQVAVFVISAVVILWVALIWNDTFVETIRALFGENNLIWLRWVIAIVLTILAIIIVFFSRHLYNK